MAAYDFASRFGSGALLFTALATGACTTVPMRDRDSGEDASSTIDSQAQTDAQQALDDRGPMVDSTTPNADLVEPADTGIDSRSTSTDTGVDAQATMDTGVDVRSATDTGVDVRTTTDTGVDVRTDTGVDTGVDSGVCPTGQTRCSGVCVDLQSDEANCGRCATPCAAAANAVPFCNAGRCTLSCSRTFGDCNGTYSDGCETALNASPNCGSCGTTCRSDLVCSATGSCVSCGAGLTACNGRCIDTLADDANCGACGRACSLRTYCCNGACILNTVLCDR